MIPKQKKSNKQIVVDVVDQGAEEHIERLGNDFDEESITQNFRNVARQGNLSPRHMEKVKSAVKGRKKVAKDNSSLPSTRVQTRTTLTKSSAQ